MKRIYDAAARHASADASVEVVTVPHLRVHPLLIQALEDRVHEALHGAAAMNCSLCKYRVRLIGREADLGQPQFGHHHQVRAGLEDEDDSHAHNHRGRRGRSREVGADALATSEFHPWDERLLQRLQLAR